MEPDFDDLWEPPVLGSELEELAFLPLGDIEEEEAGLEENIATIKAGEASLNSMTREGEELAQTKSIKEQHGAPEKAKPDAASGSKQHIEETKQRKETKRVNGDSLPRRRWLKQETEETQFSLQSVVQSIFFSFFPACCLRLEAN